MPSERLAMRHVREVMRLKSAGVKVREIARRVGAAPSTVRATLERFEAAGLCWPLPAELSDAALEAKLFAQSGTKLGHRRQSEPDWAMVHRELKRKHVTLSILWEEYIAAHPTGYRYSRYVAAALMLPMGTIPLAGWAAGASLTQHKSGRRLANLALLGVRHGSSVFFRQRRRSTLSTRTIR